jgi:hypothetical protein
MKIIFTLVFFVVCKFIYAQDITAYTDNRDNLQVFDRGLNRQIEYLPVKSYQIGGNSIAYIDNKTDFKIYYDGQSFNLMNAADFWYRTTNNLTAFRVGEVLYAFDGGEKKTLCMYTDTIVFTYNDSVIGFIDKSNSTLNFYYNRSIANVEESFLGYPKSLKSGSNIIAWVNQSDIFSVFYHGRTYQIDNIAPVNYEAGQDIVAYVDDYVHQFRLFYKGQNAIAEDFLPDSFKVGFGICAYVDNLSNFWIFQDGTSKKYLSARPDFFKVVGNVVVYSFNNTFNVFYQGQTTTLQNVTPKSFQVSNNGVAWLDDNGRLMTFNKGKIYTVSYEIIQSYFLNGDALRYDVGYKSFRVWYNGKNY